MKKYLIILILVTSIFVVNDLTKEKIVIPDNAIRFRVIANSNSKEDQEIKKKVVENLESNLYSLMKNSNNLDTARNNLKNNIDLFKDNIDKTLKENNVNTKYSINYGMNYFPSKNYKGLVYNDGKYESLVVRLGTGEGNNFWCVLFPPLCLIDDENKSDIEYHFLVKDLLDKYF